MISLFTFVIFIAMLHPYPYSIKMFSFAFLITHFHSSIVHYYAYAPCTVPPLNYLQAYPNKKAIILDSNDNHYHLD